MTTGSAPPRRRKDYGAIVFRDGPVPPPCGPPPDTAKTAFSSAFKRTALIPSRGEAPPRAGDGRRRGVGRFAKARLNEAAEPPRGRQSSMWGEGWPSVLGSTRSGAIGHGHERPGPVGAASQGLGEATRDPPQCTWTAVSHAAHALVHRAPRTRAPESVPVGRSRAVTRCPRRTVSVLDRAAVAPGVPSHIGRTDRHRCRSTRATTANLFVEQSACTRTAPTVHGRRGEPASRVRCGRAGPLDYLSPADAAPRGLATAAALPALTAPRLTTPPALRHRRPMASELSRGCVERSRRPPAQHVVTGHGCPGNPSASVLTRRSHWMPYAPRRAGALDRLSPRPRHKMVGVYETPRPRTSRFRARRRRSPDRARGGSLVTRRRRRRAARCCRLRASARASQIPSRTRCSADQRRPERRPRPAL